MKTNIITKNYLNSISLTVLLILSGLNIFLFYLQLYTILIFIISLIVSVILVYSIQMADQWEKAVVLRLGKYRGLKGPGIFFIIPIIDKVINYVDQRIRVTDFKAEQALTKDTVPVNVIAVLYWTVWDVEKAVLEVQEYNDAIEYVAQTGLRDIIGKHELSELLQDREKIASALQVVLDENTSPWPMDSLREFFPIQRENPVRWH